MLSVDSSLGRGLPLLWSRTMKMVLAFRGHSTVENTRQHVAGGASILPGLACTPTVYMNGIWTIWESQPGSILKPVPKDAWQGVRPPRARQYVEKHHRTRMRTTQMRRNDTVCIRGAALGLQEEAFPSSPPKHQ